jgi:hypothetical protein
LGLRLVVSLALIASLGCAAGEVADSSCASAKLCGPRTGGSGSDEVPSPSRDATLADAADALHGPEPDATPPDAAPPDAAPRGGAAPDAAEDPATADHDLDGVPAARDCDDQDGHRYPGAPETPDDGVDSDCDGFDTLPCGRNADCPAGQFCQFGDQGGRCEPGCRGEDCRAGLRCHTQLHACVPDERSFTCGGDADCPMGSVCGVQAVAGTDRLDARCRPPVGMNAGAAACATGDDCASGACMPYGQCLALCRADTDCTGEDRCLWTRLGTGDTAWRVRACMRPPRTCLRSGDCPDGRCVPVPAPDGPRGFILACLPGAPGGGAGGASCTQDAECASGVCLREGFCFSPCAGNDDCLAGKRCYEVGVFLTDDGSSDTPADDRDQAFPACLPDAGSDAPCQRAADCLAGEICGVHLDAAGRTFVPRCVTAGPGAPAGAACRLGADCASGSCAGGACLGVCAADADCAAGARCAVGRHVLDTRSTDDVEDDRYADVGLCVR